MISNRKIDNIGDLLKRESDLAKGDLGTLLEWRNGFSPILDYYYGKLKKLIPPGDLIVVARRLKRIESIQIKLKRFKTMRLSTLQDIAGVRAVLKDEEALDKAFSDLRGLSTINKLKRVDNYHSNPKDDGYRGVHLIYQNSSSSMVEIQLRTELEHIWSTAVEIYGELQDKSFKTGEEKWREFFLLLSSYFAIKENCAPAKAHIKLSESKIRSLLKKIIKELSVIEKLNASTNGIKVTVSKFNESGKTGKYALLELDYKNKTTTIEIFNKKDSSKAIEIYTQRELEMKKGDRKNIVFVNIEDLEKIQKSYPNYFLDTHKLLEILSKIVLGEF
jgi:putative GTP pyrophosphokinase